MTLLLEVFKKNLLLIGMCAVACGQLAAGADLAPEKYVYGRTKIAPQPTRTTEATIKGMYKKIKANPVDGYGVSFDVTNDIGRKVYVVPFAYVKRFVTDPWHWYKAPTLVLDVGEVATADIGTVPDIDDLTSVFGVLCICETKEEAEAATYQLSRDSQKVDLDLLSVLNGKTVVLHSSQYGVQGERLSYEVVPSRWKTQLPKLDFSVKNTTEQQIFVTAFFYGKEQDADEFVPWRFSKSNVLALAPGEMKTVKVDTIKDPYDWGNVKGYLGVFKEHESQRAHGSTYELLLPEQKIALGSLASLGNKEVHIAAHAYGTDNLFNVTTKPASKQKPTTTAAS